MTLIVRDDKCVVGDFAVAYRPRGSAPDDPIQIKGPLFPSYDAAEAHAKEESKKNPWINIHIISFAGQFRSVPQVFEVHHKN